MLLTDTTLQRASFAKQFHKKPDVSQKIVNWKFSKYFTFPRSARPFIADLQGKMYSARRYLDENMEKVALAALMNKLQPILFAKVTM